MNDPFRSPPPGSPYGTRAYVEGAAASYGPEAAPRSFVMEPFTVMVQNGGAAPPSWPRGAMEPFMVQMHPNAPAPRPAARWTAAPLTERMHPSAPASRPEWHRAPPIPPSRPAAPSAPPLPIGERWAQELLRQQPPSQWPHVPALPLQAQLSPPEAPWPHVPRLPPPPPPPATWLAQRW